MLVLDKSAFDTTFNGEADAFACKLNADGTDLIYSTFLGGAETDYGAGVAWDSSEEVVVVGSTVSSDFPSTPGAYSETHKGSWDGYVVKLSSDGAALVFSTFLGDSSADYVDGVDVDASGSIFLHGTTRSEGFPVTPGAFDQTLDGDGDIFVCKLDNSASDLVYATFFGGEGYSWANRITVTTSGCAVISGYWTCWSQNVFPATPNSFDSTCDGSQNAFIVIFNEDGTGLVHSTLLGGTGSHIGIAHAMDESENIYITGRTEWGDFPTTNGAFDETHNGGWGDAFLTKFNFSSSDLAYSTYLGGEDHEEGWAVVTTSDGSVFVAGTTSSTDFPTTSGAFDQTLNPDSDIFVTSFDLHCFPGPSATVTGDAAICLGEATTLEATLEGTPPWNVTWSDGFVQSGLMTSPVTRVVAPTETTEYVITAFEGSECIGTGEGSALVTVAEFGVTTEPNRCVAQGVEPLVFEAFAQCDAPPTEFEWTIPATSYSFGSGVNPITINPIPSETTDYQIRVTDQATRATAIAMLRLLVAIDPVYFDYYLDGCNDLNDLWQLCGDWRDPHPGLDDPNGDGIVDVLDFLYINLDDINECTPANVLIPDPAFKQYLVSEFDTGGDGEISIDEASLVTAIDTPGTYAVPGTISDLTGIAAFVNLQSLVCHAEQLVNLPDLSRLDNLRVLDCSGNALVALPDMSALTQLTTLKCGWNSIEQIPGLGAATALEWFNCYDNALTDLPDLSFFPNLFYLNCGYNQLSELDGLSAATQLTSLYVAGIPVGDLPDLSGLTNLVELVAGGNGMTNFPNVAGLTNLREIQIWDDPLDFIPDLSSLTSLSELSITGTNITVLPDLSSLNSLQVLNCNDNQMPNPPNVVANVNLDELQCRGNFFDAGDCPVIATIQSMGLSVFVWNPQNDGSTLMCSD